MNHEIEEKRKQLIQLGIKHGLNSPKTLHCSRELDRLLDKYQAQILKNKKMTYS